MRQTQEHLIGATILQRLHADDFHGGTGLEMLALLDGWRAKPEATQGYGPGTLVNLLRLLRGDLRGLDLSRLLLRQAYLANVDAQDVRLVDAQLSETVLAEAFDFPGSVALCDDGALMAAGTSTGHVWLWRVEDRTPLWAVQGHDGGTWAVAVSTDGRIVASGGGDGMVRLWEGDTGQPVATLRGHTGAVWSVALSADGQLVASVGGDETVRLWQASTGCAMAAPFEGHTDTVWGVAVSADGRLVASAGGEGNSAALRSGYWTRARHAAGPPWYCLGRGAVRRRSAAGQRRYGCDCAAVGDQQRTAADDAARARWLSTRYCVVPRR
jgi:hypothetical protein